MLEASNSLKSFSKSAVVISGVLLLILGEGWLIGIVFFLGFIKASILIFVVLALLSSVIILVSESTLDESQISKKIRQWIIAKEAKISPTYYRMYEVSKIIGVLAVTLIVGPLILSVFTSTLSFRKRSRYLLAIVCSMVFSTFWAGVYSGALFGMGQVLL